MPASYEREGDKEVCSSSPLPIKIVALRSVDAFCSVLTPPLLFFTQNEKNGVSDQNDTELLLCLLAEVSVPVARAGFGRGISAAR